MAATVVIEDGTFESSARLAALIARSLEQFEPVRVILRDDGPLQQWLAEHLHGQIEACNRGNFPYEAPLAERVSAASEFLESDASDLVYVYGLGATDFAVAAASQDRRVVLHAYQPAAQIEHFLARDQAKTDCAAFCDALITAEYYDCDIRSRLFGRTPTRVKNIGFRVDLEWLRRETSGDLADAHNLAAKELKSADGMVVGGSGTSSGSAEFFSALARECAEASFVWFGGTSRLEGGRNGTSEKNAARPSNVQALDRHNVWPLLKALGAYVACDRETDLTISVASAAMGIPVIGFANNGSSELFGRYGILCHGNPDLLLARDIVRKLAARPFPAADPGTGRQCELDIEGCVDAVLGVIADVRLIETD